MLNAAIDRYAYAVITTLDSPEVRFKAADLQAEETRPAGEPLALDGTAQRVMTAMGS